MRLDKASQWLSVTRRSHRPWEKLFWKSPLGEHLCPFICCLQSAVMSFCTCDILVFYQLDNCTCSVKLCKSFVHLWLLSACLVLLASVLVYSTTCACEHIIKVTALEYVLHADILLPDQDINNTCDSTPYTAKACQSAQINSPSVGMYIVVQVSNQAEKQRRQAHIHRHQQRKLKWLAAYRQ